MSQLDYNHLIELANDCDMRPTAFLRTLVQLLWLSKNADEVIKSGTLEVGGYGLSFPPEFMKEVAKEIESAFSKFDWNELEGKLTVKAKRYYKPK